MARGKTIDDAINNIFNDYKNAIYIAAQEATNKAKDDLYSHALSCLVRYYEDYKPTSYNRTYSLKDCFVPYANEVKEGVGGYICRAGVEYNPTLLENTYYGSEIYSPVDAEWIIDNYLAGIHPKTDGSSELGGGNYENQKHYGSFIPSFEMQRYIDGYYRVFDENLILALGKQVVKQMRK